MNKYSSRLSFRKNPSNYQGTKRTSHQIKEILPQVLYKLGLMYQERGDLVLSSWPEIVGPTLAPMTEAMSFKDGILYVLVKNSTLYSLFTQNEKQKILKSLRSKFPKVVIKTVIFRM